MKYQRLIAAAVLTGASLLALTGLASAQNIRPGDNVTIGQSEVIDGTLWSSGRNLDIAGEVQGDVICAAQTVTITGTVRGDVLCAAQTLRIAGTVEGDVRVAGQTVVVGGNVQRNISVATQSFTLENGSTAGRDVSVAAADVVINGQLQRDLAIASETAIINGTVGRNVKASLTNMTLSQQAKVGGDLTYTSRNNARIPDAAQVAGTTHRYEPKPEQEPRERRGAFGLGLAWATLFFISMLLLSLALVALIPGVFQAASTIALDNPLKTVLVGAATALAMPVLILGLLLTVLGIPLALFLLFLWIVIVFVSGPLFAYYLARALWHGQQNALLLMLAGSAILFISYFIPFVNIIMMLAAHFFGTGMFVLETLRRAPRPNYDMTESPHS